MPGENFVYADVDGNIGYQAAALVPVRRNWQGVYPVAGATGDHEWQGWRTLDELPHELNPDAGFLATANNNTLGSGSPSNIGYSSWSVPARINRIREVLSGKTALTVDDLSRLQHDTTPWNAEQLVPLLQPLSFKDAKTEQARTMLLAWDRRVTGESAAAALYVAWEQALFRQLVEPRLDPALAADYIQRVETRVLVPTLTKPPAVWFGASPAKGRDHLLESALAAAVAALSQTLGTDMTRWTCDPHGHVSTRAGIHGRCGPPAIQRRTVPASRLRRHCLCHQRFRQSSDRWGHVPRGDGRCRLGSLDWHERSRPVGPAWQSPLRRPREVVGGRAVFPWYSFSEALVAKNAEATLVLRPRR